MNMLNKILIVDDSEPLHQIFKVTLKRYKCAIITALHREEGLKKLTENLDVDLILIDMKMPTSRMSGMEFIKKVKEQEALKDIPIVVVSPSGEEDKIQDAIALGQGHLSKPFTSNEVHALIEKLFPLSKPDAKTLP
jgi:two-component system chemotaxis response regulator CheY